jgi:hypothetical protein
LRLNDASQRNHLNATDKTAKADRESHGMAAFRCGQIATSVFALISSALPPKAAVNRDTCLRLLLTLSGHSQSQALAAKYAATSWPLRT